MNWSTWSFIRPSRVWTWAQEQIGARTQHLSMRFRDNHLLGSWGTRDWTRSDYKFWDKSRRAQSRNLELSGLFLRPLGSKVAAWVLGDPPTWRLGNQTSSEKINDWWDDNHTDILRAYQESIDLGDAYLVINPDLSVSVIPPHVVKPIMNERDPSIMEGWRIQEKWPHPDNPSDYVIIEDEYFKDFRIRRWIREGRVTRTQRYPNLIGLLPIIHIPNLLGADELFGRPEGEALIPALHKYGEVFEAAIKGNIRQGRPTPVVQKMGTPEQVQKFWELFGTTETVRGPDGEDREERVIDFDSDKMLTLGGDAEFHWKSPLPFTKDTEVLLQILFYLVLQHTEIPEFVWGNAIQGSKASAESQILPFMKWVQKKRGIALKWMVEVVLVVKAYMAILGQVDKSEERVDSVWPRLVPEDGRLTLDSIMWAWENGLLPDEMALILIPMEIEDPRAALARAKIDFKRRREMMRQEEAKDILAMPEIPSPDNEGGEEGGSGLNRDPDRNRQQPRRASGNPQGQGEGQEEEMAKIEGDDWDFLPQVEEYIFSSNGHSHVQS